jgi:hypothetical protein
VCCGAEIVISEGSSFPDCPNHPHLTAYWKPASEEMIRDVDLPSPKEKRNDPAA